MPIKPPCRVCRKPMKLSEHFPVWLCTCGWSFMQPTSPNTFVDLESPFRGDEAYIEYARRAMFDSISRLEVPFASHLLYTQVLDDSDAYERDLGICLGKRWAKFCKASVFYLDYGWSDGMRLGRRIAKAHGRELIERRIGKNPKENSDGTKR